MKKLLTYLMVFMTSAALGQDIHFAQFTEAPQLLNPGLTGVFDGNLRVIANYRDQWGTVDSPYRTFGFNYDHRFTHKKFKKKASLAFGVAAFRDDAGDLGLHTTSGVISIASTLKLSREQFITAGVQSGILYRGVNMSNAVWGNQYDGSNFDPTMATGELSNFNSFVSPDVSMGFSWHMNAPDGMFGFRELWIEAGTGLFHLNRPKQRFNLENAERLHIKWTLHAKSVMGLGSGRSYIIPMFLFQLQGPSPEAEFGGLYKFMLRDQAKVTGFVRGGSLSMGATYRWGDAIIPMVAVEFMQFSLGVSYDVNVSKLRKATSYQGGLEVSLRFILRDGYYYTGRQSKK